MHREAAVPEMLDNKDGMLVLNLTLDLRTKKKTKFMKEFSRTIVLPHYFDDGSVHRMLVFCKTPEDKELAASLGVEFAGGIELVQAVQKGEIKHDDYDHCICTPDMYAEIASLRKHLRDRFPNPHVGSVGDIGTMFKFFTEGKTYQSKNVEEHTGQLEAPFATLNMLDNQVLENFEKLVGEIASVKAPTLGKFIKKGALRCPPSSEVFYINEDYFVPKVEKRSAGEKLPQENDSRLKSDEGALAQAVAE